MTTDYSAALAKAEGDQSIVRAQMTLSRLGDAWAKDARRGLRFIKGLTTWLSSYTNENTRRVNSYSVLEFFEWYEATRQLEGRRGQIPLPWQVTREDANAYAQYLRTRPFGLEEERLRKDPTKKLELIIYTYVKNHPSADYKAIRRRLLDDSTVPRSYQGSEPILEIEKGDPDALDRVLACMVEAKQLRRRPTIEELRRSPPNQDLDWSRVGLDFRAPPEIFRYEVDPHTDGTAEERSSTVLRRVAALSAMWRHYIERGENTQTDQGELLKYNIWADLVKREGRIAPLQQRVHRLEKTPTLEEWKKLVATTESSAIEDIRDRALLALMFWMGLRVTEMVRLKRKDRLVIDGKVYLRLLRKRAKAQLLAIPRPVLAVLDTLDMKIAELARDAEARQEALARKVGTDVMAIVPRWRRLLENPEAPLIPAVARWGCNATMNEQDQDAPITRQAVTMMLRRRGFVAGIPETDWSKLHPHGFRRLGARAAFEAGTPLTTIQTALGHDNIATTGKYVEDRDQERVALFPQFLFPEERPAPPPAAPVAEAARAVPETEPAEPAVVPATRKERREAARERKRQVIDVPVVETVAETIQDLAAEPVEPVERFETIDESAAVEPLIVTRKPLSATLAEEALAASAGSPPLAAPQAPPLAPAAVRPAAARKLAAEPPAAEEKGAVLIGLSACAPLEQAGVGAPDYAYEPDCWGENHRNACGQVAAERIRGTQDRAIPNDLVSRSFVGRASRLTWWAGTGDNLKPRMPIFSPQQMAGGGNMVRKKKGKPQFAFLETSIVAALGDLWVSWSASPADGSVTSIGPTAASALLRWVAEGLTVGSELREYAATNAIQWIDYEVDDLAVDVSDEIFKQFRSYRQHREDQMLEWYYENARTYRVSRGADVKGLVSRLDDRPTTDARETTKQVKTKTGEIVEKTTRDTRRVYQPAWYSDEDPILSLPKRERQGLIDTIRTLTGQLAPDDSPKYTSLLNGNTASMADLLPLLSAMCSLDWYLDQQSRGETVEYTLDELKRLTVDTAREIDDILSKEYGWPPDVGSYPMGPVFTRQLHYLAAVRERRRATSEIVSELKREGEEAEPEQEQEQPEFSPPLEAEVPSARSGVVRRRGTAAAEPNAAKAAKKPTKTKKKAASGTPDDEETTPVRRVSRDEFYLDILAEIFGDEIKSDPVLQIEARCDGSYPLASEAEFFRIDPEQGTIVHTEAFQKQFAEALGTHSECVARRIARDIWELRKTGSRLLERPDELIEHIDMLRAYRVPCPVSLERELTDRLPKGSGFALIEAQDVPADLIADVQLIADEIAIAENEGETKLVEQLYSTLDELLEPLGLVLVDGAFMQKVPRVDPDRFLTEVRAASALERRATAEERRAQEVSEFLKGEEQTFAERYGSGIAAEAKASGQTADPTRSYRMNASRLRLLPNPVALMFAAVL